MKLVVAIIRPDKFGAVQGALAELGLSQLTFSEVWGQGHEGGRTFIYRGRTLQDQRMQRLKVEIALEDDAVNAAVEAIRRSAKTGAVGDGIIIVTPLEGLTRIRTGRSVEAPERRQGQPSFARAHTKSINSSPWASGG